MKHVNFIEFLQQYHNNLDNISKKELKKEFNKAVDEMYELYKKGLLPDFF